MPEETQFLVMLKFMTIIFVMLATNVFLLHLEILFFANAKEKTISSHSLCMWYHSLASCSEHQDKILTFVLLQEGFDYSIF